MALSGNQITRKTALSVRAAYPAFIAKVETIVVVPVSVDISSRNRVTLSAENRAVYLPAENRNLML